MRALPILCLALASTSAWAQLQDLDEAGLRDSHGGAMAWYAEDFSFKLDPGAEIRVGLDDGGSIVANNLALTKTGVGGGFTLGQPSDPLYFGRMLKRSVGGEEKIVFNVHLPDGPDGIDLKTDLSSQVAGQAGQYLLGASLDNLRFSNAMGNTWFDVWSAPGLGFASFTHLGFTADKLTLSAAAPALSPTPQQLADSSWVFENIKVNLPMAQDQRHPTTLYFTDRDSSTGFATPPRMVLETLPLTQAAYNPNAEKGNVLIGKINLNGFNMDPASVGNPNGYAVEVKGIQMQSFKFTFKESL